MSCIYFIVILFIRFIFHYYLLFLLTVYYYFIIYIIFFYFLFYKEEEFRVFCILIVACGGVLYASTKFTGMIVVGSSQGIKDLAHPY